MSHSHDIGAKGGIESVTVYMNGVPNVTEPYEAVLVIALADDDCHFVIPGSEVAALMSDVVYTGCTENWTPPDLLSEIDPDDFETKHHCGQRGGGHYHQVGTLRQFEYLDGDMNFSEDAVSCFVSFSVRLALDMLNETRQGGTDVKEWRGDHLQHWADFENDDRTTVEMLLVLGSTAYHERRKQNTQRKQAEQEAVRQGVGPHTEAILSRRYLEPPKPPGAADAAVRHFLMVVGATVAVFGALVLAAGMVVQSPVTWGMGAGGLGVGLVAFLINLWADAKTDDVQDRDSAVGTTDVEDVVEVADV